jgi:hypothetical protein
MVLAAAEVTTAIVVIAVVALIIAALGFIRTSGRSRRVGLDHY